MIRFRLGLVLVAGCATPAPPNAMIATPPSTSAVAESTAPSATSPTSVAQAPGPNPVDPDAERVRTLVHTWSAALDQHDAGTLAPLYEEYVRLYGAESPTPKARVLDMKRAALKGSFHQSVVGTIEVVREVGKDFTAKFVKRSGSSGTVADVHARLRVRAHVEGNLVIVEESDEPSDAAARALQAREGACFAAAAAAVHGVREIAEFERRASAEADASGGKLHVGGIGPEELGDGKFDVSIGFHSEERFDGRVWYEVDRRTGHVELTLDGATLPVGADAAAKVRAACANRANR